MPGIYLDHNSTTPPEPAVLKEMLRIEREFPGNPESAHGSGRAARARLEDARDTVAAALGVDPSGVLFTSGGTESDNLALRGALAAAPPGRRHHVVSAVEHPAVIKTALTLEKEGCPVTVVAPDRLGRVSEEAFSGALRDDTALASVMTANHETGTLQPVAALARIAGERGVPFHTDAVQALGKVALSLDGLGADLLTGSAHKLGGPRGVGVLCRRGSVPLAPLLTGGEQERGLRPGTPAVALCAGLARALEIALADLETRASRWELLSGRLLDGLRAEVAGLRLNGDPAERLPNTLNLSFDGVSGTALAMALDQSGVEVSTGSACASGAALPSPVLTAMGLSRERVDGAVRISLGPTTREVEVDRVLEILPRLIRGLRR
jgi:cysteine desulfurase